MLRYQAVLCCEGEYKGVLSLHEGHIEVRKRKAHRRSSQHLNLSAGPAGRNCWARNRWSGIQPSQVHTGKMIRLFSSQGSQICSFSVLKYFRMDHNCTSGLCWNSCVWVSSYLASSLSLCAQVFSKRLKSTHIIAGVIICLFDTDKHQEVTLKHSLFP